LNYHILIQDKFVDGFIEDIYEIGQEKNNIFWIRGNKEDSNYIKTDKPILYIGSEFNEVKSVLQDIKKSDNIWIHWYDEFIADIVAKLANKIFVFFWGGEMYEKPYWYHFHWLYDKRTKYFLLKKQLGLNTSHNWFFKNIIFQFYYHYLRIRDYRSFKIRNQQIRRIDYLICSSFNQGEVQLVRKLYPNSRFQHLWGFYDVNFDQARKLKKNVNKRLKIMIGNSATPTNNHLDLLSKLKKSDADIFCLLSYGDNDYRDMVIEVGNELFKENFYPITNFMSREEYIRFLNEMDIIVMYHNRSQAWGNIATAIALGKPVFLKEKNPLFNMIKLMGLTCYDVDKINSYDMNYLITIAQSNLEKDMEILRSNVSRKRRLRELDQILNLSQE
jgi:dTDP-N-acetylfucosamine:lipid II N-acetylfucosaminyltransferase